MQLSDALYIISVASRLVDMHPATLRKYEREGFLEPSRSSGNVRLYSREDIARLRQIKYLVEERGLNLAGVELALELTACLRRLAALLDQERAVRNGQHRAGELVQEALRVLGDQQA
ncbi:MAG: MerR family transcriptional regulator [Chloroflexi bacterium]|nr:MerR family transcriptional regulator [Chloroflexota bacterium]